MSSSPLILDNLIIPKIKGSRILDVGCGYGKWGFLSKKYFWNTQNGDVFKEPFVAGVDKYKPNLDRLSIHHIYDSLVYADAACLPFPEKSFDTVLAIEIIEHMSRESGLKALHEFERVADKCIILTTPNKKCFRDGLEDSTGYNPYEAHISYWKQREFHKLGYQCFGVGFKLWPAKLWGITELSFLTYRLPMLADTLICIKNL